jgi:transcription elongation factor Elf1
MRASNQLDFYGLECPACGNENLHQRLVDIFPRREDADCAPITVDAKDGTIFGAAVIRIPNPSARRQGLSITFECEHCPAEPILDIYQHKGTTHVEWREWCFRHRGRLHAILGGEL